MNKLLIGTIALTIGAYGGIFSALGLVSQLPLQVAQEGLERVTQEIDVAYEGNTPMLPSYQVQTAKSVQPSFACRVPMSIEYCQSNNGGWL